MAHYFVLAPILSLFVLGLFITLRSGVAAANSIGGIKVIAGNFSAMLIRVVCYLAGLFMLQEVLGTPSFVPLGW